MLRWKKFMIRSVAAIIYELSEMSRELSRADTNMMLTINEMRKLSNLSKEDYIKLFNKVDEIITTTSIIYTTMSNIKDDLINKYNQENFK